MKLENYLKVSEYIDWDDKQVFNQAMQLSRGLNDEIEIAKNCFEWVRDEIKHSLDYQLNPVTLRASEVLAYKTGFCYAKSHLLAALLRGNQIPAGFCYQRLSLTTENGAYCLHGLNAVYLKKYGWYRIDARGNKKGVDAQFAPPVEKLAFAINKKFEVDMPDIYPEPLPQVIEALNSYKDYESLKNNLPDIVV